MNVLVIGGGGREHALCWKLAQGADVGEVYCAPGNPGTAEVGTNLPVGASDVEGLVNAARLAEAGLVVVGPEDPLVNGVADRLRDEGIPVFGPSAAGAELEGSKAFAKDVMNKSGIPTAGYRVFKDRNAAVEYLDGALAYPVVVKASGLAAGKGAIICEDRDQAVAAVDQMMVARAFGAAGDTLVVEDFLSGFECSVHGITDGRTLFRLPTSQDHKRALDGDQGLNTGGMGAISPCPQLPESTMGQVEKDVLFPTLHALVKDNRPFRGVLYAGLMITRSGPKVLEFNVRFGDPETQVLLPRLRGDLAQILLLAAEGRLGELSDQDFAWDPRPAVTVVLAAEGYPGEVRRGDVIEGVADAAAEEDVMVFHAGTALGGGRLVTAGGRVLGVTAVGDDMAAARARAYRAVDRISFSGMHYRTDIGGRGA